jgi:hypothetical protein
LEITNTAFKQSTKPIQICSLSPIGILRPQDPKEVNLVKVCWVWQAQGRPKSIKSSFNPMTLMTSISKTRPISILI